MGVLKLEDLRGNLVSYEIVYHNLSEEQCPVKTYRPTGNTTISVTGGDSYAVIAITWTPDWSTVWLLQQNQLQESESSAT